MHLDHLKTSHLNALGPLEPLYCAKEKIWPHPLAPVWLNLGDPQGHTIGISNFFVVVVVGDGELQPHLREEALPRPARNEPPMPSSRLLHHLIYSVSPGPRTSVGSRRELMDASRMKLAISLDDHCRAWASRHSVPNTLNLGSAKAGHSATM